MIITVFVLSANAKIANTKHNLSSSGVGTIKATSETEICAFCHIPHDTRAGKPLWNRETPATDYMYKSEYMSRTNYATPNTLGMNKDEPGIISRQCLSCHDGTIAIGDIYMIRGSLLGDKVIDMIGLQSGDTLSLGDMGYLGTDLSIHHPVGVEYNPNNVKFFDIGSKSIELQQPPLRDVRLYKYFGEDYIECSSCHDPHSENRKFLRVPTKSSYAQTIQTLCTNCHDKDGWSDSPHRNAQNIYTDSEILRKYEVNNVAGLGCINCHTPHNGNGKPSLLRQVEQKTCFQGASSSISTAPCHGMGGAKDVESILMRKYSHPVKDIDGIHSNLDSLYGTGVPREPIGSHGVSWDDSKHAECMDCHNQHKATAGTHTPVGQWYPNNPTNRVSNVLKGVAGVEPSWTPRGVQPDRFTTLASAEKEYQICLKCHSYWGLGRAENGVSNHYLAKEGIYATDQAFEFNPNNRSAHPVIMPLNDMPGSYSPKSLRSDQLLPPWNMNPGNITMYCSDCHGADNENSGDIKGPHGSNHRFMLKGVNKFWPAGPDGRVFDIRDIDNASAQIFCKNCHDLTKVQVHKFKKENGPFLSCINCHVAVPHGSPVSRLIGYRTFPEPYNYQGNSLGLTGFRKNPSGMIDIKDNAYAAEPRGACVCHATDAGFYDSYP